MRILVVDDSQEWRDLTEAALAGAGFTDVRSVGSAEDAFRELRLDTLSPTRTSPVDLIILDVVMPGIDGVEACAQIRNHPDQADVPIIMLTAANEAGNLSNAFDAGATDYVAKPFDRAELLARVNAALKTKAELDRRRVREDELVALATHSTGEDGNSRWIDPTTGLFVGVIAEAYANASSFHDQDEQISIIALAIDRMDTYRFLHGEELADQMLARVAGLVRNTSGTIGTVAAIYLDGVMVLIGRGLESEAAKALGNTIRAKILEVAIPFPGAKPDGIVTASVGAITARMGQAVDGQLMTGARTALRAACASKGAKPIVAVDLSCL
jgi:phosphoserine phosphatase RsbU/P